MERISSSSSDGLNKLALKRQPTFDVIPKHLLSVKGLSMEFIQLLLDDAQEMKALVAKSGGDDRLKHRVLASIFYEASTRTSCSFQAAMLRLGGTVISVNSEHSSVKKGETLEDTIQTMCCYCDAVVLRHPLKGSALAASEVSTKPVVNAGDGSGEHPTQALLDLFTIKCELGRIGIEKEGDEPMVVALLGDLKNGRTVHSLVMLLSMFVGIKILYVSPAGLEMPSNIVEELKSQGFDQSSCVSLDEAIAVADVLYVTRIQKERFDSEEEYNAVMGSYCVDEELMKKAKQRMIVMHPLPRVNEISVDVDKDLRAAYFRQMENGMYVRMALLSLMINH